MGLTTCPKCGETISDKATVCPHCNSGVSKNNLIMCEDCKKEYNISMRTCPNCRCPNSTVKRKKKKHKGVIISSSDCCQCIRNWHFAKGKGTEILFKYGNSIFYNA